MKENGILLRLTLVSTINHSCSGMYWGGVAWLFKSFSDYDCRMKRLQKHLNLDSRIFKKIFEFCIKPKRRKMKNHTEESRKNLKVRLAAFDGEGLLECCFTLDEIKLKAKLASRWLVAAPSVDLFNL
jgi:hypothetical protein